MLADDDAVFVSASQVRAGIKDVHNHRPTSLWFLCSFSSQISHYDFTVLLR